MDPNWTLATALSLAATILADDTSSDLPELAADLAEEVENLNAWLSKGGFLPKRWER